LIFISRWFQIESLYKFNTKFCPVWVPRFFVFPGTRDAVRVGVAALEAEAFLVWPKLELRRLSRKLGLARARRRLGGRGERPPAEEGAAHGGCGTARRGHGPAGPHAGSLGWSGPAGPAERVPVPGHGGGERHP